MCYDAKSSMNGFLIGGSASLYLIFFSNNPSYKHIGVFFAAVVLMQLAEYFIWIDQDCDKRFNELASKSVIPILVLQVFALIFGGYLFNTTILPSYILKYASIITAILFLYLCYNNFYIDNSKWCTKPNKDKRLQWDKYDEYANEVLETIYNTIFILIPFFFKNVRIGFTLIIAGMLALINTKYENKNSWNSEWCFYSAIIPVLFVLINIIERYFNKKFPFI